MLHDLFSGLLPSFLPSRAGGLPKFEVVVTPSDEVLQLRQQVEELEDKLASLKERCNRIEYLYNCECIINLQITDYCRDRGWKIPRRYFDHAATFHNDISKDGV